MVITDVAYCIHVCPYEQCYLLHDCMLYVILCDVTSLSRNITGSYSNSMNPPKEEFAGFDESARAFSSGENSPVLNVEVFSLTIPVYLLRLVSA